MIILHQNKQQITNFDNMHTVYYEEISDDHYAIIASYNSAKIYLGHYETRNRVEDILDKITNAYGLGMYMYKMPNK